MSGFDENIVREYFELNGFFVRQVPKYSIQSRKKSFNEVVALLINKPDVIKEQTITNFQLFSADMESIQKAVVVVRSWYLSEFSPELLKSSSKLFNFLKKNVFNQSEEYFSKESFENDKIWESISNSYSNIIVLPGLPSNDPHRSESIEILKANGIDGIITYSTVLESLLRQVQANIIYQKSDLLQLMRILKIYNMVKDPQ
ncbi:MAG: hypothetical protein MK120_06600, partial [Puniceicoccaceae bacterium]|nr:hypothetical protein [Puniceicoccaceae bacterium]